MKVAITGIAGFISGYIVRELQSRGYDVCGIDNFSKYGRPAGELPEWLIEGDCKDRGLVSDLLDDCDYLIAGAAMIGGIEYFHRYPYDLLAENERIMASTCDAAIGAHQAGRLKRVVYLSSSMVYESTDMWPSAEGDEKVIPPPVSSYGFQKLAVEYFARAAYGQYGLPYTIVRPFNCVGVGEGPKMSHVVPDLIRKILSGQDPLRIYGDGNQVRHYTYGADLARGIVTAMEHPDALNEDFNLSSPESTTVLELAGMIWAKLNPGKPFRWESDKPFPHDVRYRVPDTGKAERVLGWEAATPLSSMVDEVIDAIRSEAPGLAFPGR